MNVTPAAFPNAGSPPPEELSRGGRYLVLLAAFLGWTGAGMQMSAIPARPASIYFLRGSEERAQANAAASDAAQQGAIKEDAADASALTERRAPQGALGETAAEGNAPQENARKKDAPELPPEEDVGYWTAWFNGGFLLGAALGGLLFGSIGDHLGRAKAMGLSILCYSFFAGTIYFAASLPQLVALRFLCGLGVGGMWPTGVALANEAWAGRNRGLVSGVIGTAANVGLSLMGVICAARTVTLGSAKLTVGRVVQPDDWRWVMLVNALPAVLGVLVLFVVPESPAWRRKRQSLAVKPIVSFAAVFRPPHRRATIIGIVLGMVPLFGGWGCVNWAVNWSDEAGLSQGLKADTQFMRSFGAVFGSLVGGWLATQFGRRTTYFMICLGSFAVTGYLFWFLTPRDAQFLPWVFVAGLVATTAFGWLPLCLPELFPTEVRAAGAGVSFNFGRIFTAIGVLGTGYLMGPLQGEYALVGRFTHWIFAVGMITIFFAPDTSQRRMDD